jgi:predicted lipoprotein
VILRSPLALRNCLALGLSAGLLLGCVGDDKAQDTSPEQRPREFNYVAMMANYADNLIVPQYQAFADASVELAAEAGADYCAAIGTDGEAAARSEAQAAWRSAMDQWQQAELFLVGPATDNGGALRNRIYSYGSTSTLSTCAVDQSVVLAESDSFDIQARSFNSRGLDALEYLLFNDNLSHTCPARITETQDWDQRPEHSRKVARCHYAALVAQDVAEAAQTLVDAWTIDGGHYRYRFVDPANQEANLSALSDALFYIETDTKDAKLGIPTGIHRLCSQVACPEAAESKYSETSLTNIRHNLVAFRRSLKGGEGLGFDDLIVRAGFPEVVDQFDQRVEDAIALIDSTDTSLYDQTQALLESGDAAACLNSAANPDSVREVPVCSLHGLLKRITDGLRTDFVTIVNLDLPDRAQSDND